MKYEFQNGIGDVYCTLEYVPEDKILYSTWFGEYLSLEHIKTVGEAILWAIKEFDVTKFLNDNQQLNCAWDAANEWVAEYWMPKTIEFGLRKIAHVFSPDIFTHISGENMQENSLLYEGKLEVRTYDSFEQARQCLLSKNNAGLVSQPHVTNS